MAAERGNSESLDTLADLYRNGNGVVENKRKALVSYKRAANNGNWDANSSIGEMYRDEEGVAVNIKKAIYNFDIVTKYESDDGHLNLAFIFPNEQGYLNEDRALYHFRLGAELAIMEATEAIGEYFVSVSGPRKLSLSNDELQVFLRKVNSKFARRSKGMRNIRALEGLPSAVNLDCTAVDFTSFQTGRTSCQLPFREDLTPPPDSSQDIPPISSAPSACFLGVISGKYPYWWVRMISLIFNLFIFISYSFGG